MLFSAARDVFRVAARQAANFAKETVNRAVGLPEAALNLLGGLPAKKLRVRIVVLSKADGSNVLGVPPDQLEATLEPTIQLTREILWKTAGIRLVAAGRRFVQLDPTPAPRQALNVHCNRVAFVEDYETAGRFFTERLARTSIGNAIGTTAPITAFVVESIDRFVGCSIGPLADYVTLQPEAITMARPWALAHEIGHACGLWHVNGFSRLVFGGDSATNLMDPFGSGEQLTRRQVVVLRNSRHVTFL